MALRLRSGGIVNHELLKAVEQTPRTLFAPPQYQDEVYSKRLIPLECGSFMEGCDMAVRLLHCLNLKPGQRILEVGTGSGFTAAVMGRIAERVLTIDRYQTLVASAQKNLRRRACATSSSARPMAAQECRARAPSTGFSLPPHSTAFPGRSPIISFRAAPCWCRS